LTTPGPSPWHLRDPAMRIFTPEGEWTWEFFDGPTLGGMSRLQSPLGTTVLLVDFYCYVQPLPDARLLVWFEIGRQDPLRNPGVHFTLIDLRALEALNDSAVIAGEMKEMKQQVRFSGGAAIHCEFTTTLDPGTHSISAPFEFHDLAETLVLADYGIPTRSSNHFDQMYRAIFAFDFEAGRVTVMPQRWFNEGNYDFGYQWIARVQRDPRTGRIVGEGVRIPPFRLDETGTNLA
jgi:hypothetical protein